VKATSTTLTRIGICLSATIPLLFVSASTAAAAPGAAQSRHGKAAHAHGKSTRHKSQRRHRRHHKRHARRYSGLAEHKAGISGNTALSRREDGPAQSSGDGTLDAGFESGLLNWNTAGVGDAVPTVSSDVVRSGANAADVVLTDAQDRSELILGGDGGGSTSGMVEFTEGAEYYYGFSFYIQSMVYGRPGAHNVIMQFKSDGEGSPNFDLSLWDYQGQKGLWSEGDAMGGNRFLAPATERQWHDVVVHFKASRQDAGFYEVYLDGALIDARSGVSMIRPDRTYGYIKNGLYRNGDEIPGTSELRLDAARLGTTASSVAAG
jgi:hypothetical protein